MPDRDANGLPDVDRRDLPDFDNLYETYYRSQLGEIPEAQRPAAQRVLEDGLLASDPLSGEGRRMSVDSRALLGQFAPLGLDQELLDQLERSYLIRREANTVGGFSYEISHDTLVAPVQKAKAERLAAEEKAAARRRIRRLLGIVGVVGMLLVGAGLLTAYAFQQRDEAVQAKNEAEDAKDQADAATAEALRAKAEADSLKEVAQASLRQATRALLETNQEKLRAAEVTLSDRQQALRRMQRRFADMPEAIRPWAAKLAQAQAERDRYQAAVDSLQQALR